MRTLTTALIAAGALGAASFASASPAQAQYWHHCWGCGPGVPGAVIGGAILGLGLGTALTAPPYQGPGTLAPYQPYRGPAAPYYGPPPPVAYNCHYERVRDYDAYGNPIVVRQRVCD